MQVDLQIFNDFEDGLIPSTLRIYSWKPKCISLGYSQKRERLIDGEKARQLGWEVVRRPTGGGIVFHNEAEVTYSLVTAIDNPMLPEGLVPSYIKISQAVMKGLSLIGVQAQITNYKLQIIPLCGIPQQYNIYGSGTNNTKIPIPKSQTPLCFSYPVEYEIVVEGKKIVGSAQKRGRRALLQQGSIFVRRTDDSIFSVLKQSCERIGAVSAEEVLGREVSFEELSKALVRGFEEGLGVKFG